MCGIAGFIAHARHSEREEVIARRMADAISHRGPDDQGIWVDGEAGVALAHRRLSIVDLSPAGHQPMFSDTGRWVIVFNGEIYNHAALRSELEQAGRAPSWHGHCDTEVLLAAISAWGVERTLKQCVGMFAFALWDRKERTLVLARDRLGEKPLYYGWADRTFLFGSELCALQQHPDWGGEIDRDALYLYLRHSYVPAPRSIYAGISKLPPGSYLLLKSDKQSIHIETYWDAREVAVHGAEHPFQGSPAEAVEHCETLLRQSLSGQMMADVPLGAFLSGGIDSSTVVSLMQALSARPVETFSIGFNEDGYDEAPHAKAIAEHLGSNHTELYVSMKEAMVVVPRLPSLYSEPFADVSQIPTFLVSQLARRHVTVALSGDGGDELFSGYTRYQLAHRLWPLISKIPLRLRSASSQLARGIPPDRWTQLLGYPMRLLPARMKPQRIGDKLHKAASIANLSTAEEIYEVLTSIWQRPDEIVLGSKVPETSMASPCREMQFTDQARRMMFLDLIGYLPDDILTKVDRASMAVGLECRVPILDHRLVEFTWTLPLEILRREGRSKWPLRQILSRYVPQNLVERPKMGFGVPIDSWLRGPLKDWAEALLDERRLAEEGFFDPTPIRSAWRAHQDGNCNLQHQLWSVLMFQAWQESQHSTAKPLPITALSARH